MPKAGAQAIRPERIVTVAQIGCGYWGPNLLRNFTARPECRMKWVVDSSPERRDYVKDAYPAIATTPEAAKAFADPEVEAVIVATPAGSHFALAQAALKAGKHVLVEKPMALDVAEAEALLREAAEAGRVLMAGHTYLYNDAVNALRREIEASAIGDVLYFHLSRLNLGIARSDVNAWWNLAPHDVSMLLYLLGDRLPAEVSATGVDFVQKGIEDAVFARLAWTGGVVAHIHVSWLNPDKVRRLTLVGSRKMAVLDELAERKLSIYDKGIERMPGESARRDYDHFQGMQLVHRSGPVTHPAVVMREPLAEEARDFLGAIVDGRDPLADARHGRDVVAVLAAGQQSLKQNGKPVAPAQAAPAN